ncbi:AMP-binding protein, partial [Mycolicibacterium conceptionense]|uniref:AMP-binding protein n=2 Tax=Mycolicibacterium TaxID=1866885 RepID=UPI0005BDF0C0
DVLDEADHLLLDQMSNRRALIAPVLPVSVPAVFARWVARTPSAAAVTFVGNSMTYQELDEASNRLAHRLIQYGAGPGRCVAVLLERSAEAVVSILAVLKSGASYLPIDPLHPAARIEFVLSDADPVVVISSSGLADRVAGHNAAIVDVDDETPATWPSAPLPPPSADDIAYVIYTSGTTGVPKGVAITHHNITQLMLSGLGVPLGGAWPLCHSLAFDVSAWETWGALLHGGRLVVVPESVVASAEDFHDLLVAERISVLTQTPSAAAMLATAGLESTALMVAGEACPAEVVDRWAPGRLMVNAYGPTETTMGVTMSAPLVAGEGVVPIGAPVSTAALFVLD